MSEKAKAFLKPMRRELDEMGGGGLEEGEVRGRHICLLLPKAVNR